MQNEEIGIQPSASPRLGVEKLFAYFAVSGFSALQDSARQENLRLSAQSAGVPAE